MTLKKVLICDSDIVFGGVMQINLQLRQNTPPIGNQVGMGKCL